MENKIEELKEFTIYQIDHYEDCDPFINDKLLLVCDGLGGSGSTKHEVEGETLDEEYLKSIVIPEDTENTLCEYFKTLWTPIMNKPSGNTTAMWASRIVAVRYVYAINNGMSYDEAKDFVYKGLEAVALEFKFEKPSGYGLSLLPTTLVSIIVKNETAQDVEFDVVWAGDSRAYALNKDGLIKLSVDDEDASGGINNLFSINAKDKTKLNVKSFTMKKPVALVCVSDGIFDNRDYLDVENIFISNLVTSKTITEYQEKLRDYYEETKMDDCTIAFKLYSKGKFTTFRDNFKRAIDGVPGRYQYIQALLEKKEKYKINILLKENPGAYKDYFGKLASRVKMRFGMIVPRILDTYKANPNDPFVYELLMPFVDNADAVEEMFASNKEIFVKIFDILKIYAEGTNDSYLDVNINEIFDCDKNTTLSKLNQAIIDYTTRNELVKINELVDSKYDNKILTKAKEALEKAFNEYLLLLHLPVAPDSEGTTQYPSLNLPKKAPVIKIEASPIRNMDENTFTLFKLLEKEDVLDICNSNNEYLTRYDEIDAINKKYDNRLDDLIKELIEDFILKNSNSIPYLTGLAKKDSNHPNEEIKSLLAQIKVPKQLGVDLSKVITDKYNNEEGYKKILSSRLSLGSDYTSPIDSMFNASVLKSLLEYTVILNNEFSDFEEFYEEYQRYKEINED